MQLGPALQNSGGWPISAGFWPQTGDSRSFLHGGRGRGRISKMLIGLCRMCCIMSVSGESSCNSVTLIWAQCTWQIIKRDRFNVRHFQHGLLVDKPKSSLSQVVPYHYLSFVVAFWTSNSVPFNIPMNESGLRGLVQMVDPEGGSLCYLVPLLPGKWWPVTLW